MILNVEKAFIRRVISLTHRSFRKQCMLTVKKILVKNSFPPKIVDKLIHQVNSVAYVPSSNTNQSYAFMDRTTRGNFDRSNMPNDFQDLTNVNRSAVSNLVENSTMGIPQPSPEKKVFIGMAYIPKLTEQVFKQIKKHIPNLSTAPRPMTNDG